MFFEDLARTEGHHTSGGNPNFLTGPWIATFARSFASNNKISKAGDLKRLSLLEHALNRIQDQLDEVRSLLLRNTNFFVNFSRQVCFPHPSPPSSTGLNPFRVHQDTKAFSRSQAEVSLAERRSFTILYSMLSANACQLASMMFSETPTVPHFSLWSPDSMSTRTREAVPLLRPGHGPYSPGASPPVTKDRTSRAPCGWRGPG